MVSPWIVLPLLAAIAYATAGLVTHRRCKDEKPLAMAFHLNASLTLVGGTGVAITSLLLSPMQSAPFHRFLLTPWQPLDAALLLIIAGLGILIAAVTILVAKAYQSPRPALIGVFDNAYLGFAGLWSFTLFGVVPQGLALVGLALIACAGAGAAVVVVADLLARTVLYPVELPVGGFTAGVAIVAGGLLLVWRRPRAARTAVPVRTDGPAAAVER